MISWVHPGLILILGSLLIPFLRGRVKQGYMLLLPVLGFISVLAMHEGTYGVYHFLGQEIVLGRVDRLATAFGFIFTLMMFIGVLYGLRVKDDGHHLAGFFYAGSALGATFAGDFLSFLVFWEIMAFASVFLVTYNRTDRAYKAAYRYILVHATSGVCLMAGILLQYYHTNSLAFAPMELSGLPAILIFFGFAVNAGLPFLGAWLPDAYPESTLSGGVMMASFTTKTAVYALARGFAGAELLVWIGAIMALYSVAYATIESDMRKLLSHHILSQVGYMVAGIGVGTRLGIDGAVAHAFTNILYKGLLFMATGSIIYVTGRRNLKDTGGLYKTMPYTFILFMIGGFSISGVPLFAGFASKPMILSAAAEEHYMWPWLLMMFAAAGTFLSTTLKLPYLAFLGKDKKIEAEDPPCNMLLAMAITAFLCVLIGVYPNFLYRLLPYGGHYHPYTVEHFVWTMQILLFTWLGYYFYIDKIKGKHAINLDADWFYRKAGAPAFMWLARKVFAPVDDVVSESYKSIILRPGQWIASRSLRFDKGVVDGIVNGVANFTVSFSSAMRRLQTGILQDYAFAVFIGLLFLLNLYLLLF